MADDRLPNIEKLNQMNWPVWKLQMQSYMQARELWSLCTGDEAEPAVPAADAAEDIVNAHAQAVAKYQIRVARTKSILFQTICTSQLHVIAKHHLNTPHLMWTELVTTFERPSLSNKLQLQTRMLDLKLESGSSVNSYLKELQDLTERLAALGAPVDNDFQVAIVLRGLPSEFDALRVAFVTKGAVTMSELREALLTEEQRMKPDCGSVGASVLSVRGNGRGRGRGVRGQSSRSKEYRGSCYGCGQMGHMHKNCPTNPYIPASKQKQNVVKHGAKQIDYRCDDSSDDYADVTSDGLFTVFYHRKCFGSDKWIIDSGATKHMTPNHDLFTKFFPFRVVEPVSLGNGTVCNAVGIGCVSLKILCNDKVNSYILTDVLYVPNLTNNFFSVSAATSKGYSITFAKKQCLISQNGKLTATGSNVNHIWYIDCLKEDMCASLKTSAVDKLNLWHKRLGHVHEQRLKTAVNHDIVAGIDKISGDLPFCEACIQAKQSRKPFKSSNYSVQSTCKLELVHSDVCGPMSVPSLGGARYFVTFIDDFTRCCRVYFLKHKSEVLDKFKEYESEVTNKSGQKIKTIRTDNGGEYTSREFENFLKLKGIRHELTVPYSPAQNGIAERLNRTLQEMALSQLIEANLPKCYWAESVATACYTRNRLPVLPFEMSPFERWFGRKPSVKHFRVFGCTAYVMEPNVKRQKFDIKSGKMIFLGYHLVSKGYRLYDPKKHRVVISRDVVFNESDFQGEKTVDPVVDPVLSVGDVISTDNSYVSASSQTMTNSPGAAEQLPVLEPAVVDQQRDDVHGVQSSPQLVLRRSSRATKKPDRFGDWVEGDDLDNLDLSQHANACATDVCPRHCLYFHNICEPSTFAEALKSPEADEWKLAADAEMNSLESMKTWDLVSLPHGKQPIGCRWVFRVKHKPDGTVERFKARLVAKGYAQRPGIDFNETFAPVVRLDSMRSLLAYAVQKNFVIHQMDVVTAFLNGELDEEIYMEQPPGYATAGQGNLVCRLRRSLYGLKQSPRCWNSTFCKYMKELGFVQLESDCCIFRRVEPLTFIALYVDDLIVITENTEIMRQTKQDLMKRFDMKDMGPLHHILNISCIFDEESGRVGLSQEQYINKLIDKFGLADANVVSTPLDMSSRLVKSDGVSAPVDKMLYQSLVGSLLYVALGTRPDIQHAVSTVAKYCSEPNQSHLTAAKRILRYLKKTKEFALWYHCSDGRSDQIVGFADADYAGDSDDRHSTSGYVFLFGGGAITWYSGKQKCVSTSTTEAEYVALCHAAKEAVFLRRLMSELDNSDHEPLMINEDNQSVLAVAKNPVYHSKTKHIDVCYHFTREAVASGHIRLQYCCSNDMVADILTKPLSKSRFQTLCLMLGLSDK
jgi:Reverse transcriptase (RNA-dependent DNA polymerase)/gag-polypeptide of LTR copia-type/Integrase core domain/GAG-pre-integrase domain/Domain of unknown function (DUF4219)